MDMVDIANHHSTKQAIQAAFNTLKNDEQRLTLCRELTIESICNTVRKFPQHTQKEIINIIAHRFLTEWNTAT